MQCQRDTSGSGACHVAPKTCATGNMPTARSPRSPTPAGYGSRFPLQPGISNRRSACHPELFRDTASDSREKSTASLPPVSTPMVHHCPARSWIRCSPQIICGSRTCSHGVLRGAMGPMLTADPLWEQSLLAMAVGQSAVMLDVLTLSPGRASFHGAGSLIPAAAHHLVQRPRGCSARSGAR